MLILFDSLRSWQNSSGMFSSECQLLHYHALVKAWNDALARQTQDHEIWPCMAILLNRSRSRNLLKLTGTSWKPMTAALEPTKSILQRRLHRTSMRYPSRSFVHLSPAILQTFSDAASSCIEVLLVAELPVPPLAQAGPARQPRACCS